jgi:CRP-like cAMP-binding protein
VGPGQCFGELALLSGECRAANVMALDNSEVIAWPPGYSITTLTL